MKRLHIHVTGIVQGVGFRPFVYNLAKQLSLKGWVLNSSEGVHIEVEGRPEVLEVFLNYLVEKKPPRAEIREIKVKELEPANFSDFEIKLSSKEEREFVLVSPDIATCHDCLKELFDPEDRRYRYPFINCTNCGPRFTIIEDIPYDRPNTTMKKFEMCHECKREYEDPSNRRFHAQPNACPECGPHLMFVARSSVFEELKLSGKRVTELSEDALSDFDIEPHEDFLFVEKEGALQAAEKLLRNGKILALKGLGGFHLACLAKDRNAVDSLRKRKKRPSKAFAVMFRNIEDIKEAAFLSEEAEQILKSPEAPIVLVKKREPEILAESVAPGLSDYGVMLPSTPLHHLLLNDIGEPLIMTSGNLSEEPIARDNSEAICRLKDVADGFLIHNRPIHSRYDDSVLNAVSEPFVVRRARSLAPYPLDFRFKDLPPLFGAGPELKCTFTLTRENYAFVSQHLGDLEDELTFKCYVETFELYKRLFRIEPEVFCCDLHPDYLSTRFAEEISENRPLIRVQHHFAHIASVIGEHEVEEPVIGFAFDGTGYGIDGTVWGGEIIVADGPEYSRAGSIALFPLPTGENAIKKPYRIAAAVLSAIDEEFARKIAQNEYELLMKLIETGTNCFQTSSLGRLFDAVAVIVGIGLEATYEGELAMKLEALTRKVPARESLSLGYYSFGIIRKGRNGMLEIDWKPMVEELLADVRSGTPREVVSCRFHNTVAKIVQEAASVLSDEFRIRSFAFSGGVFQNAFLNDLIKMLFSGSDYKLYFHRNLPPNDGCISFGQVVFAAQKLLK